MISSLLLSIIFISTSILLLGFGVYAHKKSSQRQLKTEMLAEKLVENQTEFTGRLQQLAEQTTLSQNQFQTKLQDQERQLSQLLSTQIKDIRDQLGNSLDKSNEKTQNLMTGIQSRLSIIDKAQDKITSLSSNIIELQNILNNKQARGAFGEIQLKDLVSDNLPPNSYEFQALLSENKRVDCLLKLPYPPGPISIDAKFPLEAYYKFRDAESDEEKAVALRQFAINVEKHIKDISEKYIIPGTTSDTALMFIPSEAVYAEIYASLPKTVEKSYQSKVFMVSPTTLWATLNTVRAILKDVKMREQAHLIQKHAQTLMKDVTRLDDRVIKLQRHFDQSHEDLRQIRISTDKVNRHAEKIETIEWENEDISISQTTETTKTLEANEA